MNKARERKKRARRLKSHRPSQGISAKLDGEEPGPRVSAGGEQRTESPWVQAPPDHSELAPVRLSIAEGRIAPHFRD